MLMMAISAVIALLCAAAALRGAWQKRKLEEQLTKTYDMLGQKERANSALMEELAAAQAARKETLRVLDEMRQENAKLAAQAEEAAARTEAVQNALKEVQNIWNYVGDGTNQQDVEGVK